MNKKLRYSFTAEIPRQNAGEPEAGPAESSNHDVEQQGKPARRRSAYEGVLAGGAWVVLGRGMSIIATVVMNALLARDLSYEEFGAFFVARSLGAGLCLVALLGWNSVLVRFVAESLGADSVSRARQFIYIGCVTLAVSTTAWLAVLFGPWGQSLGHWLRIPHSSEVIPILGVWMCLSAWHQLMGEGLRGCNQQQFANFSAGEMGGPIANAAFCLVLLVPGQAFVPSLASCIWVNAIIQAVLLPLSAALLWMALRSRGAKDVVRRAEESRVSFRVVFSIGIPLMLMHLLSFMAAQGDLWIAAKHCSSEDLAIFAAARRLTLLVTTPQVMANLAVLPTVAVLYSQGKTMELQNILQRIAAFAGIFAVLSVAALLVRPDLTVELIYGSDYRQATTATIILVSGHLFLSLAGSSTAALTMTGHHRDVLLITGASALMLVSAGPWAARAWGASGIATVAATVVAFQSILAWVRTRQIIGIWTHPSWKVFFSEPAVRTDSERGLPDAKP